MSADFNHSRFGAVQSLNRNMEEAGLFAYLLAKMN